MYEWTHMHTYGLAHTYMDGNMHTHTYYNLAIYRLAGTFAYDCKCTRLCNIWKKLHFFDNS